VSTGTLDQGPARARGEKGAWRLRGILYRHLQWLRRHVEASKRAIRNEIGGFPAALEFAPGQGGVLHRPRRRRGADGFASVDELVAGVAHEIRNPLSAIRMWMSLIQETVENDAEFERRCSLVTQEIARLERLSQSLVEFVRMPEPTLRPQLVSVVINHTLEMLAPKFASTRIRVGRRDSLYVPPALLDEEQFEQVLINILVNAMEAMGNSGEIEISTGVELHHGKRTVVLVRIQDSGPGLPAQIRERAAAEPFVTTKRRGRGLGLYLADRIMRMHGGSLSIASPGGAGTVVELRIPAVRPQPHG
jgi:signal transduction histidine kinase